PRDSHRWDSSLGTDSWRSAALEVEAARPVDLKGNVVRKCLSVGECALWMRRGKRVAADLLEQALGGGSADIGGADLDGDRAWVGRRRRSRAGHRARLRRTAEARLGIGDHV